MRRRCRDGYGPAAQTTSGECAEDRRVSGACRRQIDTDAGSPLDDARSDLDQAKAHRGELCVGQLRACGHGAAHGKHEPVGRGVQDQAELVGFGIAAGGAVGSELALVQLDESSRRFPARNRGSRKDAWRRP